MANENSKEIDKYSFLYEKKTSSIFGKLDYALRSGVHIQREYPLNVNLFRFLNEAENFESLKNYYSDLFNLGKKFQSLSNMKSSVIKIICELKISSIFN